MQVRYPPVQIPCAAFKTHVMAVIACSLIAQLKSGWQPPAVHVWAS